MGLAPDLLNENFDVITSWADGDADTAVSEIDPAGQLRLDTNLGAAGNAEAIRNKVIASPPNLFTVEIQVYCDDIGTLANSDYLRFAYSTATWTFRVAFASNGLFVYKTAGGTTEVGADIVAEATLQLWRFQVNKTAGEASATVEAFLNNVSQGTVDCDYELARTNGQVDIRQIGWNTDNMVSHVYYIRIATGLGAINDTSNPQILIF